MGSKKDTFEHSLLDLIFLNAAIANIGSAGGLQPASAAGSLYVALFTVIPSDSAQGTETTYTDYARVAVARTTGGWTVSGNTCSNAGLITFPVCGATAGGPLVGFAICTGDVEGVDDQLYWGALTSLIINPGITPEYAIGDLTITED